MDILQRTGLVTVSYGSGVALDAFLLSLFQHHPNFSPENVVVVDNKPDHDNVKGLADFYKVRYLPLPSNPGYGSGMNAGASVLNSSGVEPDFMFFCNPDVKFIEPVIGHLGNSLASDPTIGSIGPRLLNTDGTVYPSARNIPSLSTGIGHGLLGKIWPENPWSRRYKDSDNYGKIRFAGSLSGAAVMTSQSSYDALGGWDEKYFMHFEDIDLGWRLTRLGYSNVFDPTVSVEHSGGHSTGGNALVVEQAMTQSAIRFMNKRYSGLWNTPIRWSITAALRARGALKTRSL